MELCGCCGGSGVEIAYDERDDEEVGRVIVGRWHVECRECGGIGAVYVDDAWDAVADAYARMDEHKALAFHKAW